MFVEYIYEQYNSETARQNTPKLKHSIPIEKTKHLPKQHNNNEREEQLHHIHCHSKKNQSITSIETKRKKFQPAYTVSELPQQTILSRKKADL